jgi:hypothetical protein
MADDPIYSDKDIFEQGASGVVATLALAAANSGAPLSVQGAMAMVGSLLGLGLGRQLYRAAQRRFPLFATGFLRAHDPDPEKAQGKAEHAAEASNDSHEYHDTILRSFRQMMDAADESVVETLGYLAGVYAIGNKKPDAFFRGLGRLLCDLEDGELEQLKVMLRLALAALRETPEISLALDRNGQLVARALGKLLYEPKVVPDSQRLFMLLKREGLGGNLPIDGAVAGAQGHRPDREVALDAITVSHVMEVLDPLWRSTPLATASAP